MNAIYICYDASEDKMPLGKTLYANASGASLASVWLTRSLSQLPLFPYGPVSQPCTMENSKCSKGNSRSLWSGPVILVRVLPLFFLEYPRATCHDFHPHRYILPVAIVATISCRREIYIISFPRDRGPIRPLVPSPSYRDFFSACISSLVILTFRCRWYLRAIL